VAPDPRDQLELGEQVRSLRVALETLQCWPETLSLYFHFPWVSRILALRSRLFGVKGFEPMAGAADEGRGAFGVQPMTTIVAERDTGAAASPSLLADGVLLGRRLKRSTLASCSARFRTIGPCARLFELGRTP
jgi:hypothetical protein